jgi:single-strand DNA-binding protein
MARGINKVMLLGNLGGDPDVKYTQAGNAIARVNLATTSSRKDRDGNIQERTEWHRVVFFGKLAEIAGEYLRKGSQVFIEGTIRYDKYVAQDGVEKYTTDIVANELQMLGGRTEGGEQRQQAKSSVDQRPTAPKNPVDDFDGFSAEDDIPF